MIRLMVEDFEPWDVYSARVLAVWRSYDDAQCWAQCSPRPAATPLASEEGFSAVMSLVDGFAILAVKQDADREELTAFLQIQPWARLQCDAGAAARLPFPHAWRSMMLRFAAPKKELVCETITVASDPGEICDILARCGLGIKNRNDWMADLALRWRRGTAKTWILGEACTASAMAVTPGHVYIGALGTLPEHRGKGLAGRLISHICGQHAGREVWLSCREELQGFYESVGFERTGDMITLKKEDDL